MVGRDAALGELALRALRPRDRGVRTHLTCADSATTDGAQTRADRLANGLAGSGHGVNLIHIALHKLSVSHTSGYTHPAPSRTPGLPDGTMGAWQTATTPSSGPR
ncbi:hypothetical protein GCM10009660_02540 [Catellatospora bangladeshensis]